MMENFTTSSRFSESFQRGASASSGDRVGNSFESSADKDPLDFFEFGKSVHPLYCSFEALKNCSRTVSGLSNEPLIQDFETKGNNDSDSETPEGYSSSDNENEKSECVKRGKRNSVQSLLKSLQEKFASPTIDGKDAVVFEGDAQKMSSVEHLKKVVIPKIVNCHLDNGLLDNDNDSDENSYNENDSPLGRSNSDKGTLPFSNLKFGPYKSDVVENTPQRSMPYVFDPVFERHTDTSKLSPMEVLFLEKFNKDEEYRKDICTLKSNADVLVNDIRGRLQQDIQKITESHKVPKGVTEFVERLEKLCLDLQMTNSYMKDTISATKLCHKIVNAMSTDKRTSSPVYAMMKEFVDSLGKYFEALISESDKIIAVLVEQKRLIGFSYIMCTLSKKSICHNIEKMILENNNLAIQMNGLCLTRVNQ
jgi:hypothetical protein